MEDSRDGHLTAVTWCDGDLSQVHAIEKDNALFSWNRIRVNYQNAARTGVEQSADLAKVFTAINDYAKTHTVSHIEVNCLLMKNRVTDALQTQIKDLIC
jgi:hypothetical protein